MYKSAIEIFFSEKMKVILPLCRNCLNAPLLGKLRRSVEGNQGCD